MALEINKLISNVVLQNQLSQAYQMIKINYPLLYFELFEKSILGILVGTGYQLVDKDLKSLKSSFISYLQKDYKKNDYYPYMEIKTPRLKEYKVSIRPTYREETAAYPLFHSVNVPVPVIYGETGHGYYECYLPLFDESFYYYDTKQLDSLVQHFSTNILNRYTPEKIYKYMKYQKPQMDIVTLRVNPNKEFNWGNFQSKRKFKTLSRLAESFPYSKNIRKNTNALPDVAWELEHKVSEVIDKLISTRSNVLIVGESGVGKSAILKQVIKKISSGSKKQKLDFTFWRIMPQRITASAKYLGEWEETVEELIDDLIAANGILWVIDIIQLLQIGGSGPEDSVAAFLLAFLQQGKLQLIGEARPQELESMRRLLPGFVENFQIVRVDELPEQQLQAVLDKFCAYSSKNMKVAIPTDAMTLAYRLLLRYYPYESFPGKGIKFMGQCISEARLNKVSEINKEAVISNFINQTGLPELFLRDDLLLDQEELQQFFNKQIIGQPAAVDKLCAIVKIYKAGLNNPYKPINTLLFAGPTGVGKTASAKALANYFFGKGQKKSPLIRIDMSEFQYPGEISRLIGSGQEVGQLVKDIRERPFSVLLLDEVEKAHPSVFDVLLTVLDEGILVDAYGRVTNFRNTIIIMTSNLGASNKNSIGFGAKQSEEGQFLTAIERHFRPEFVNRIDGIVSFNPLDQEDIRKITIKELDELKQREGFTKRNLNLEFSSTVIDHLAGVGFDERYGARPLQRAIEQSLINPMANWLLKNAKEANRTVHIDFKDQIIIS